MDIRLTATQIEHQHSSRLIDCHGRTIDYLRLSVTDRCNLRCFYCMRKDIQFLPRHEILSLEEIERLAATFIRLGIRKLRLTGGEPLARPGVIKLVEHIGDWVGRGRLDELTLTTNGTLLVQHARMLAACGVRRINVSLDTLSPSTFEKITGSDKLYDVLTGIDAARAAGLAVRINTVVMASVNESEYDNLIRWAGNHQCDIALIELMPMSDGTANYLPLTQVLHDLHRRWTLTALHESTAGPAKYMKIAETGQRLALITPMSHAFCTTCNRVRVTCTGQLIPCLGKQNAFDLKYALRSSDADEALEASILSGIAKKPAHHHFESGAIPINVSPMWQMGG